MKLKLQKYGVKLKSRAFKRFNNANLLKKVDFDFLDEVQDFWLKNYGKKINPINHIAYMNLLDKKDVRIVPSYEMWNEIIPFFNDMSIRPGYSDKNLYDQLINTDHRPETVLKKVHGNYFNKFNETIDKEEAEKLLLNKKQDLIIKPSNTDNGKGVSKLVYKKGKIYYKGKNTSIEDLSSSLSENFIVQTVIKQHPAMAEPHPASVNSLRMVTLRWKGKIRHLLTYARFGGGNNVKDHAIAGGVSVSVDNNGTLGRYGLDTYCNVHTHHPTTNYSFVDNTIQVPNYNEFKKFVINLHKNILHHDYVSWDIAVGYNGQPVFIEPNFRGTTWRYQLASKRPIFGDLTEEIINHLRNELPEGYNRSHKFLSVKRLKRRSRRISRKNKELKKEINKSIEKQNELQRELTKVKNYLDYIHSSKSWKITQPLRNFYKLF